MAATTNPSSPAPSPGATSPDASSLPSCSVVVPTHDRPRQLAACLDALARLEYPASRLELILVDDGGHVGLRPVIAPFAERLEIRLLSQERSGPAAARNAGVRLAEGDILAFTDDDCQPAPDWLRRLVERVRERPGQAAGGHTVNGLRENLYAATSQLIIDLGYAQNNADPNAARFFTSNNLAVPAREFRTIGGFDATFITSEDREFCDRWGANGFRLAYEPAAVVYHAHELTFHGFCRQHFAYGRGAYRFHRIYARRARRRVRFEPSFYLTLLRYPFRHAAGLEALRLAGLLQIWNIVNTAGFMWQWSSSRRAGESRPIAFRGASDHRVGSEPPVGS